MIADISGLTPAERIELESAIESRLGDHATQSENLLVIRTDNRARIVRFVRGFGARVEGVELGIAMVEAGIPAVEAARYLIELPSPEHVGPNPEESCPEGFYWDKAIAECRPSLGSDESAGKE